MIDLYYGGDFEAVRAAARKRIDELTKEDPSGPVVRLDSDSFTPDSLDECIRSQGLFFSRCVVDLKDVCELAERRDVVLERLDEMKDSPNAFVWSERALDAKSLAEAKRHVASAREFPGKAKARADFNTVFEFATAVASRDKRKAWAMYADRVRGESSPEETSGTLAWQFKMIALAHVCGDATEAGVSPYAFSNAKRLTSKVSRAEALSRLRDVVSMYHDAHRGRVDLDMAIERFVLNL